MSRSISRFRPSPKATVCFKDSCVTVYDEVADVVNAIVVAATIVIVASLAIKALK